MNVFPFIHRALAAVKALQRCNVTRPGLSAGIKELILLIENGFASGRLIMDCFFHGVYLIYIMGNFFLAGVDVCLLHDYAILLNGNLKEKVRQAQQAVYGRMEVRSAKI